MTAYNSPIAYNAAIPYNGEAEPTGPTPLPTTSLPLPVIVVQLVIDGVTHYFSDIEYGDAGTRWHDARVVGDIAYSRSVGCVLWADQRGSGGLGNIELLNNDGALDALLVDAQIDATVAVFVVDQDQPMSAATQIAAAVVERIEAQGERTVRIVTGDILALLDVPLQSSLYATGDGDATLIGRPRPVAIGNPLSCPIVLVDGIDYEYDCHDTDAHTIVKVRDMGIELDVGTLPGEGYKVADPPILGIELLQTPVGRVVADISATSFSAEAIIGAAEGDFATDILDWNASTSGTATAAWDGVGAAELTADGTSAVARAELEFPTTLAAGETYSVSVDVNVTSVTGPAGYGGVQVYFEPTSLVPGEYVSIGIRTTAGTETMAATFVAPSAGKLVIECVASGGATADALIDTVRLDRTAAGGDVVDVVQLLLARAGISSDQIAASTLTALDADRPWAVSYWADGAERIGDVLQQVMDSVYGWVYTDATGDIAVGRLIPPEAADSPVLEITTTELAGEIEVEPDLAPGLSTTVAGQRNWYRYGEGELADGVLDADRPILTADYRVRKTSTDPVGIELGPRSGASVSDLSASGIPTLIDDATDLQAAADYLADLYPAGLPRRFYKVPVFLSRTEAATLAPGDKITLTYDRFGCAAGRDLRVVAIEGRAGDDLCILRCWGSAVD